MRYFLRRFLLWGLLCYSLLLVVLLSCNLVVKLPFFQDVTLLPLFILTLIPVSSIYALPLSACLAVYMSISSHFIHHELYLIYYLKSARRALTASVLVFSLFCSLIYAVLLFEVTPRSYKFGKQLLFAMAQKQLFAITPGKFHELFPGVTIYFHKKSFDVLTKQPVFQHLFLAVNNKDGMNLFTAQEGVLKDNLLILRNGSLHSCRKGKLYVASFQQTNIYIDSFLSADKKSPLLEQEARFVSFKGLVEKKAQDRAYFVEFYKRFAQVAWQFALPCAAYFLVLLKGVHSVLFGLSACGLLFLGSYVVLMLATFAGATPLLALFLFYLPILFLLFILLFLLRRRTYFF